MKKKYFTYLKTLLLMMFLAAGSVEMWGQEVIYYETFGTTGSKTNVGDYDGWNDDLITPVSSGTGGSIWKISATTTNPSDYTDASGSCNAYSGSTGELIFAFGDKIAKYKDVVLTFGYFKGSLVGRLNSLKLFISKDGGTTWSEDILPQNTGASNKWYTVTYNVDNSYLSNFAMKFYTSTNTNRVDDIKLTGTPEVSGLTTEVTPGNIESADQLARNITASGDWTQDKIETLALRLFENATPVTSVKFTGSVSSTSDEILGLTPNCLKIFGGGVAVPDTWTLNVVTLDVNGDATSENISLDAGFPFATPVKIKADNASFIRENLVSGNKNTIYLPFAFPLPEGIEVYTFSGVEGNTVNFGKLEETTLAANTPYLIVVNGSGLYINEANVEILPEPEVVPEAGYAFLGTYKNISAAGSYGFKDNSFKMGVEGATVPAFRAYVKPSSSNSAPSVLNINILDDGLTGVENATQEGTLIYEENGVVYIQADKAGAIAVYDTDGKLVRSVMMTEGRITIDGLAHGIYIINNQKITVK